MVYFFISPVLLLLCSTAALVHGQYGHFRPYPAMAMDHGFSPYHPARINQETLPISQAEFAQLVAESMATSNGPHHHHPPNTDADYEGPSHYSRDAAMSRPRGGHSGGVSPGGHGHHAHHDHHAPQPAPVSAHHHQRPHDHEEGHHPHHHHHHQNEAAHYQPEEAYHQHRPQEQSEADHDDSEGRGGYQRAPVYENSYHNDHDEEGDELDQNQNAGPSANYGGRAAVVGGNDGSGSDGPAYDNYDHPHHLHHQEERNGHHGHGHHQPAPQHPRSASGHQHHDRHHHHPHQHNHQQQQNLEDVEESRLHQSSLHYVPVHATMSFV